MQDIFIARQPIVDRQENLVAFELLFRSAHGSTESGVVDDTQATAQLIINAFEEMGIADVLGAHKGFINLDAEFLTWLICYPNNKLCWSYWKPSKLTNQLLHGVMN